MITNTLQPFRPNYFSEIHACPSFFHLLRVGAVFTLKGVIYLKVDSTQGVKVNDLEFRVSPNASTEIMCERADVVQENRA